MVCGAKEPPKTGGAIWRAPVSLPLGVSRPACHLGYRG